MFSEENKIDNDCAKEIMLDILSSIAKYCDTNNFRYYLAYGTLIGAIRHKGFIPWDNDIDIWMPRPDYNKLREMVKDNPINENILCLDYRNERTFPFLKASDKRTRLKEHFLVTENNLGLYVDILPLDGLPDDNVARKKIYSEVEKYKRLFSLANYRFNTGSSRKMKLFKNLFYPISRLMSSKKICTKIDTLCSEYEYDKSQYVGNVVWGYTQKEALRREWFKESECLFEGKYYKIPHNYDEVLRTYYGDYMKLPSEDKRIVHYYNVSWKEGTMYES